MFLLAELLIHFINKFLPVTPNYPVSSRADLCELQQIWANLLPLKMSTTYVMDLGGKWTYGRTRRRHKKVVTRYKICAVGSQRVKYKLHKVDIQQRFLPGYLMFPSP